MLNTTFAIDALLYSVEFIPVFCMLVGSQDISVGIVTRDKFIFCLLIAAGHANIIHLTDMQLHYCARIRNSMIHLMFSCTSNMFIQMQMNFSSKVCSVM